MKPHPIRTLAIVLLSLPLVARADSGKSLSELARQTSGALAMVRCTFDDGTGELTMAGQGVCIRKSGVFLTTAFDARLRPPHVKKCEVIPSGTESAPLAAEVLSIDPVTGISSVRCTEPRDWPVVKFASRSELTVGQRVISFGLMPDIVGNPPYLGVAYVSAKLRVPEHQVYVSGGKLTCHGSPVFTADGRAVGLVARQLSLRYEMLTSRGRISGALQGRQECDFFMPIEEFANVVAKPSEKRRLAWTGILSFQPISEDAKKVVVKWNGPAVRIAAVIPGHPADKAGLSNLDVIVQMDGKDLEGLATPELTATNLQRELFRMPIGRKVKITVLGAAGKRTVTLTLDPMPLQPFEAKRYFDRRIGLIVREKVMLDEHISTAPSAAVPGLLVIVVPAKSPAENVGLKANDLITSVNAQPVQSVMTFREIVDKVLSESPPKAINLSVRRGRDVEAITIRPLQS